MFRQRFSTGLLALAILASTSVAGAQRSAPSPNSPLATLTVNSAADTQASDGQCTLREAITNANDDAQTGSTDCVAGTGADTIIFNLPVSSTITLTSSLPALTSVVTIDGSTALSLTVSGNAIPTLQPFTINSGAVVTLTHLTIAQGRGGGSGGNIENLGTLTLNDSLVTDGSAGDNGGGIYVSGTLTINNSVIFNNFGNSRGGGLAIGGGTVTLNNSTVYSNSVGAAGLGGGISTLSIFGTLPISLTLNNSTVSGNVSPDSGGGLYQDSLQSNTTFYNSTVSGNTSTNFGGGLYVNGGLLNLQSTILGNNTANAGPDCYTVFTGNSGVYSLDYNLIGSTANCTISSTTASDILGVDPQLLPLGDNGGSTPTHALQNTSPAIGKIPFGVNGCGLLPDQRGIPRPQPVTGFCDMGAFEYVYPQPSLNLTKSVSDANPQLGQLITYTIVVTNTGAQSVSNGVVFDTLSAGLTLAGPVALDPPGAGVIGAPPVLASSLAIAAGGGITLTYPVIVSPGLANGTLITNTVAVAGDGITTPVTGMTVVAVVAPEVSLSNETLVFGNQTIGTTSLTQTVLLTNTGGITLTLGIPSLAGANPGEFALTTTCANMTLAPNSVCTLNVHFAPTVPDARAALILIPSDANGSPHYVYLFGAGAANTLLLPLIRR